MANGGVFLNLGDLLGDMLPELLSAASGDFPSAAKSDFVVGESNSDELLTAGIGLWPGGGESRDSLGIFGEDSNSDGLIPPGIGLCAGGENRDSLCLLGMGMGGEESIPDGLFPEGVVLCSAGGEDSLYPFPFTGSEDDNSEVLFSGVSGIVDGGRRGSLSCIEVEEECPTGTGIIFFALSEGCAK